MSQSCTLPTTPWGVRSPTRIRYGYFIYMFFFLSFLFFYNLPKIRLYLSCHDRRIIANEESIPHLPEDQNKSLNVKCNLVSFSEHPLFFLGGGARCNGNNGCLTLFKAPELKHLRQRHTKAPPFERGEGGNFSSLQGIQSAYSKPPW